MGGSYGGYMVMAGVTELPSMFAAGANLFGVEGLRRGSSLDNKLEPCSDKRGRSGA